MNVLLRDDVLRGRTVALRDAAELAAAFRALGAEIAELPIAGGPVDALVCDLRPAFGSGGMEGLRGALDGAWETIHAVLGASMRERGGLVCLVAPRADAGPHAGATRDAAENLARVLSIEWSRFGIRPVAVAPGPRTSEEELTTILAYLASPAGDYFSGTVLSLA